MAVATKKVLMEMEVKTDGLWWRAVLFVFVAAAISYSAWLYDETLKQNATLHLVSVLFGSSVGWLGANWVRLGRIFG